MAQTVKRLPAMRETWVQSLGREDPLEKEMAAHSSILAWRIPWTQEAGRLQSTGSQRVRLGWATSLSLSFFKYILRLDILERVRSPLHGAEQEWRRVERALPWSSPAHPDLAWLTVSRAGRRQTSSSYYSCPPRAPGEGHLRESTVHKCHHRKVPGVISGEKKVRAEHQRRGGAEIVTFLHRK